jgi:hypothetical protein
VRDDGGKAVRTENRPDIDCFPRSTCLHQVWIAYSCANCAFKSANLRLRSPSWAGCLACGFAQAEIPSADFPCSRRSLRFIQQGAASKRQSPA